jgi:PAS domain-containing protein
MAKKITCENSEEKIKLLEAALKRCKQAEKSLRVSEHQFRQIYEHTQVGIAQVSLGFVIERANPAYCRMLGYTEEELRGKHLKNITNPEVIEENLRKQAQLGRGEIVTIIIKDVPDVKLVRYRKKAKSIFSRRYF